MSPFLSPSFRRAVTSLESEGDSNSWRSRSHSDELFQSMGSSPSTESFMMEGEVFVCSSVSEHLTDRGILDKK